MTRRFQFSIRFLLVATAGVAAAVAAFVAELSWTSLIARDALAFAAASIAIWASVATSGRQKVFWIAIAVPFGFAAFRSLECSSDIVHLRKSITLHVDYQAEMIANDFLMVPALWCIGPINGLLCVFVHWLIWPRSPDG